MALFRSAIVYLSVVLPFCAVHSGDPLTWASIEAQGAYIIGDGKKCSAIPNTFEMRADGAWLPASAYDLTGNFDDDCGITVTLSIPSESSGPDPEAGRLELEKETKVLTKKMEELEEGRKNLTEAKKGLEGEKKEHQDKMEEVKKERKDVDEKRAEVEVKEKGMNKREEGLDARIGQVKKRHDNAEKRGKQLEEREDALKERREKHERKSKEYEEEKNRVEKKAKGLAAEKENLMKLYENCKDVTGETLFVVPTSIKGTHKKICTLE